MKSTRNQYIFLIIFLIFGIIVAVQVRSTLYVKKQNAASVLSMERLKTELADEQKQVDELKTAIDDNQAHMNELIAGFVEDQSDTNLSADWSKVSSSAGLTDVKGPGIRITLDDAPARSPDTPVNWQIIHDQDIKIILNELKKSGAQAIAINGERVVPMSEQICAGPTILINENRHSVPYVIEAIGDQDLMFDSVSNSNRVAEMTEFNVRVDISREQDLTIPKFTGAGGLDKYISGLEVVAK